MPTIANTNFRVRNGLYVSGNSQLIGNTIVTGNLTTNGTLIANGSGHELKSNTNFGTGTLHINGVNKRVVVNSNATTLSDSPTDWAFEVIGKTNFGSNVVMGSTLSVNGAVAIGNSTNRFDLSVSNSANVAVNLNVTGNGSFTGNNFVFGNSSVTTPNTTFWGDITVKGKYISDSGNKYDLDDLSTAIGAVPLVKIYDVNGTQLFP